MIPPCRNMYVNNCQTNRLCTDRLGDSAEQRSQDVRLGSRIRSHQHEDRDVTMMSHFTPGREVIAKKDRRYPNDG